MKIKVCGMKESGNIKAVLQHTPDYMGFIFYEKSPRYFSSNNDALVANLSGKTKTVGVFVNHSIKQILNISSRMALDYIQLHGEESPAFVRELSNENIKLIKAFRIKEDFDWSRLDAFAPHIDFFLFDTATHNYGGSGLKFDWNLLAQYNIDKPFFLSGGISINALQEILSLNHPQLHAIDINSRFEVTPGMKNPELVQTMINQIRDAAELSS